MTAPIETILTRLHKVRQRQPGQWSACCPAHDDEGPSLSVRETAEGAVLLHCFGGCSIESVVAALGLDMADLFPPRERPANAPRRTPRLLTAGQALELLDHEAAVIAIAGANLAHGLELTGDDLTRVLTASGRICWLREEVRHA